MNRTPSSPNPSVDPKVRLRHHSLMQDYRELHIETEVMRKKLQTVGERKATLMAEVRFLRRRYRHLRQDQPVLQPPDMKKARGRSNGGRKSETRKMSDDAETKHVWLPDLNHSEKGEVEDETEAMNNSHERMTVEESKRVMSGIEIQQQKEMKLSTCRNGGEGSNKRKISWQDPLAALRV